MCTRLYTNYTNIPVIPTAMTSRIIKNIEKNQRIAPQPNQLFSIWRKYSLPRHLTSKTNHIVWLFIECTRNTNKHLMCVNCFVFLVDRLWLTFDYKWKKDYCLTLTITVNSPEINFSTFWMHSSEISSRFNFFFRLTLWHKQHTLYNVYVRLGTTTNECLYFRSNIPTF